MATISILANTVRPSVNRRSDDTTFGAGTFSWQDPVHSWKAGPGEVMTVENYDIKRALYALLSRRWGRIVGSMATWFTKARFKNVNNQLTLEHEQ